MEGIVTWTTLLSPGFRLAAHFTAPPSWRETRLPFCVHQKSQSLARIGGRQNTVLLEDEPLVAPGVRPEPQSRRAASCESDVLTTRTRIRRTVGRIQSDVSQPGSGENGLLLIVDGAVLPPRPQHRQIALLQLTAAAKFVAWETKGDPQPFAVPELSLAVAGTFLNIEPSADRRDFDFTIGMLTHRVAITRQAVHETRAGALSGMSFQARDNVCSSAAATRSYTVWPPNSRRSALR